MAIEKLKSTPSYHTYKAKSKPKPTTRPNFTNKQTAELSNGMRAYNSILIRRNPILFNKKKISKLKNQVAKDFFNELNANSPQKCALLLNNEDFARYCDYEYGIFTDKYKSKKRQKVDIFKKSLDNVDEKELKNILAALSKRLKSLYGAYIINAIILYSNNKEAFEYLINSPVDNRKALLPRYSRDLCEQVLGKLPPDVVQTISYNTLKVIEKGIKSNFDFSPYTKDSDRFLNSQEDIEETREYLSNCVCEGDFRAYRGEKSSWIFETIKIDKDMQEEIRLLVNSNPNSKRDIIFPNNKRYSDTAKESIYSYITDNKSDLTLADAMLVCKYADKDFIEKLAINTGLSTEYIEKNEQKRTVLDNFNNGYYVGLNNADELFVKESTLIKELAKKESCVIIGRCADFILKDNKNVIKIFISNSMNSKIKRATKYYGMNKENAEKEITKINKLRENHYKYYTENNWKDPSNYDICINSDSIGIENSVDIICNYTKQKDSGY